MKAAGHKPIGFLVESRHGPGKYPLHIKGAEFFIHLHHPRPHFCRFWGELPATITGPNCRTSQTGEQLHICNDAIVLH
jgi:hypothetical protein